MLSPRRSAELMNWQLRLAQTSKQVFEVCEFTAKHQQKGMYIIMIIYSIYIYIYSIYIYICWCAPADSVPNLQSLQSLEVALIVPRFAGCRWESGATNGSLEHLGVKSPSSDRFDQARHVAHARLEGTRRMPRQFLEVSPQYRSSCW